MIIFNSTFIVPDNLKNDFLDFIRTQYIPQAVKNNVMTEPRLSRVFGKEEDEGCSYALEFKTDSVESLEQWNKEVGIDLFLEVMSRFEQNVLGFATVMQNIDL